MAKYFPESPETQKGHMKKIRKNIRSTKILVERENIDTDLRKERKEEIFVKVFGAKDKMYTDQPGRFPVQSVQGHNYMMVMCEVDGN